MKADLRSLLFVVILGFIAACSSTGSKNAQEVMQSLPTVREPSPINPSAPPKIALTGVGQAELIASAPLKVGVNVANYTIDTNWQHAALVLNDGPPIRVYKNGETVELREGLVPGPNILRAYLLRSWGESLKNAEAFTILGFYFEKRTGKVAYVSGQPVLTLNSPRGMYAKDAAKNIPFDFIVYGTQISGRRHKILYSLNGEQREITNLDNYSFQNLPSGTYQLKVEIVDANLKPLKLPFTTAESTFTVDNRENF